MHVLCTAIIIPHVHETVAINTAMRKHAYAVFQRKHNQRAILMKGGILPRVGTMFLYFPVAVGAHLRQWGVTGTTTPHLILPTQGSIQN